MKQTASKATQGQIAWRVAKEKNGKPPRLDAFHAQRATTTATPEVTNKAMPTS
jgi:hypothetical protein